MSSQLLLFFLIFHLIDRSQALICAYGDLTTTYKFHSFPQNVTHCKFGIIALKKDETESTGVTYGSNKIPFKVVVHPRQAYDPVDGCYFNAYGYIGCVCAFDYCNSRTDVIQDIVKKFQTTSAVGYGRVHLDKMLTFLEKLRTVYEVTKELDAKKEKPIEESHTNYLLNCCYLGWIVFIVFFVFGLGSAHFDRKTLGKTEKKEEKPEEVETARELAEGDDPPAKDLKTE